MRIRTARADDWPGIWRVFEAVVREGETLPYDTEMTEAAARASWLDSAELRPTVATDDDTVLGTATMGANRSGPGGHIATATFMVGAEHRGRGVGRALVKDALAWAAHGGFRGMQFNAVAESNGPALALYRDLGFVEVGRVPAGFRHPSRGYVDLLSLHRELG